MLVCRASKVIGNGPGPRRLLRELGSCWTRRPVVTISSPMEDKEEEEGCEDISTQDSTLLSWTFGPDGKCSPSFRRRGGIPVDLDMLSAILVRPV